MMRFLLECLLALSVVMVAVCYCTAVSAGGYSRMEEADEFKRWQRERDL